MIAIDLNREVIRVMMNGRAGKSGAHTTIDGRSGMNFRMLPAKSFRNMGVLSDRPEDLALAMVRVMNAELVPLIREEQLQALRCTVENQDKDSRN